MERLDLLGVHLLDKKGNTHGRVHLPNVQGAQGARRQGHPRRCHPVVLSRREDRRGGPERHGQVHAAQDHGRHRGGQQRRCSPDPRLLGGHPAAGAAAGRGQDRPGEHRDGVRRREGRYRPLQRDRHAHGRARRRLRRAYGGDGQAAGRHRRGQRLGPGQPAVPGHGRAAVPRPRHAGERALRRRTSSRGAVPSAARGPRPAASRRAHQPPGRRIRAVAGEVPA